MSRDYNFDSIGEGCDLVWASSTLNVARQNIDLVMKKVHHALNPQGVFINLSEGLTEQGTRPDFYVLCTLGWAMTSSTAALDQGFIAQAMVNAGFRSVVSRTLNTAWGPMDMDIARK